MKANPICRCSHGRGIHDVTGCRYFDRGNAIRVGKRCQCRQFQAPPPPPRWRVECPRPINIEGRKTIPLREFADAQCWTVRSPRGEVVFRPRTRAAAIQLARSMAVLDLILAVVNDSGIPGAILASVIPGIDQPTNVVPMKRRGWPW